MALKLNKQKNVPAFLLNIYNEMPEQSYLYGMICFKKF